MIIDYRDYVPPDIFQVYGSKSIQFIDPKIIEVHRILSEMFNVRPIVNNYHLGGKLKERGYRLPSSNTGAILSQHKFGRALDFTIPGLSAAEVYKAII